MPTCSVASATYERSTGYHTIVISPPVVPSPYNSKNAGRKKTNPVWNFFVDLKTKGLSGVRCRYCDWITNDRSPTTLKFHLKRKHDTGLGGIWNIVEERIGINQPQNRPRPVICKNILMRYFVPQRNRIVCDFAKTFGMKIFTSGRFWTVSPWYSQNNEERLLEQQWVNERETRMLVD
ncbi:unnamed protein product [Gongylonema pulchrum]|uniref:BED-type domain-containing protein n=1 Tax=Gongylonema pulchrum TaxID=637853 RepID=A0A183DUB1_9BILA|nr:unnamed protein product [Gongylonema pulchrum]